MIKETNRKGIMFTVVSVLVCALIITTFFTFQSVSLDSDVENTKLRIKSIDRFVSDADSYVSSLVYRSGKSTVDFTLEIMISNNSFLTNYTHEFVSCLETGNMSVPWRPPTLNISCPPEAYLAKEFKSFEKFSNQNLNLHANITLNGVGLEQEDPYNLLVTTNYTIAIVDAYAFWNETRITKTRIGIAGLRDPTYAIVNVSGDANKGFLPMRETNHVINVSYASEFTERPSTAHSITINGSYFAWIGAPSYLERLEGIKHVSDKYNFSGSNGKTCTSGEGRCGIASIIPEAKMQEYATEHPQIVNPSIKRSYVDFEFWGNKSIQQEYLFYGRYDFWKMYGSEYVSIRHAMGVTVENGRFGLNGSALPIELMEHFHMTDSYGYIIGI